MRSTTLSLVSLLALPACVSGPATTPPAVGVATLPAASVAPPPSAPPRAVSTVTAVSSPSLPPVAPAPSAAPIIDTTPLPEEAPTRRPDGLRADGLEVAVLVPGSGREAQTGDHLRVHYVGTLLNGKQFDSSRDKGRSPFRFVLGAGSVIKGWEEGVVGMQVGEVRRLTLPPELAYGDRGRPPMIPERATLVFEVQLLAIESP